MKPFTIIIPTMWLHTEMLRHMLEEYAKSSLVEEIIVISNSPNIDYHLPSYKVVVYQPKSNLYVNPSWNRGVELCETESLILANDDIVIDEVQIVLEVIYANLREGDVIGVDVSNYKRNGGIVEGAPFIEKAVGKMCYGFGTFIAMKTTSYVSIPKEFKVWYGDAIFYMNNVPKVIKNMKIDTTMQGTTRTMNLNVERRSERIAFTNYVNERK